MPPTSKNGLEVLLSLLGLGVNNTGEVADVVFAAIDFENLKAIHNCYQTSLDSEFGISTLDTRELIAACGHQSSSSLISTREIVTCSKNRWSRALRRYRFGVPDMISIYDMKSKIEDCLLIQDKTAGGFRPVILIKHGRSELETASYLRVTKHNALRSTQAVLDTSDIANQVLDLPAPGNKIALEKVCKMTGVLYEFGHKRHAAGNDANLTLRVLLMLAVQYHEQLGLPSTDTQLRLIQSLRQICLEPFPPHKSDEEFEDFMAAYPYVELDDPNVPVDMSFFHRKSSRIECQQKAREKQWAKKLSTREMKRERAEDALRRRDLNVSRDQDFGHDKSGIFEEGVDETCGLGDLFV